MRRRANPIALPTATPTIPPPTSCTTSFKRRRAGAAGAGSAGGISADVADTGTSYALIDC
jgi:hypothetical protein